MGNDAERTLDGKTWKYIKKTRTGPLTFRYIFGGISPDFVQVQLYADPADTGEPVKQGMERGAGIPGRPNAMTIDESILMTRGMPMTTDSLYPFFAAHREIFF